MTTLPLIFKDPNKRSCQFLVDGTLTAPSTGSKVNLYSRFQERLNSTSNLAKSEYDARTSEALNSIYDLASVILSQQLKQERTESDSQNGNYADKLFDEANLFGREYIPPRAVASSAAANMNASSSNASATSIGSDANANIAEKEVQLINSPVVVTDGKDQLAHGQARKIQKASRIFRRSLHRRPENFNLYPRMRTGKRQSSRAKRRRRQEKLSSSQSQERPYYALMVQQKVEKNIDDNNYSKLMRGLTTTTTTERSLETGFIEKTNDLAVDSGCNGDSNKPFAASSFSSVKWRRKLQIDGRKNNNNSQNCWSWPILFGGKDQSNGLIQSSEDMDEEENGKDGMRQQHDCGEILSIKNDATHKCTRRSADSFPEVFSRPTSSASVESNSVPIIGSGNELNEAIKNANSLLTNVQGVASNSNGPIFSFDDSSRRVGKQTQTMAEYPLNGLNTTGINTVMGDAGVANNFTNVMEKVLDELESLKQCKAEDDEMQPEGSPCDISGSWNSETIGLQFHISITNPSTSSRTFVEGKKLDIELGERLPPRRHDLMDCDWFVSGNTVKQVGGPFYMTAQKADRFIVATFAGLCKTCGGIPTIFGSWTFVYPANDCQDISLAVDNKRDILRRDTLESKRKNRRDRFNSKTKTKCSKSLF
ncbi:uncharacterized protein LOC129915044 [Episyrphus balteatus]|uniref:uncharacterized protein LOC129915044 n=1 Tax=Episyrphus balteatus TaxID=286459 RepID=UPI002484EDE1|nr:uncharacterized protein LOC129915044 [Episyrphus balteatus]